LTTEESNLVKIVVVTGASSGIGATMAKSIAAEGWRVAIGARRGDRLKEVSEEISAAGGDVLAHSLDVSRPESIDSFFTAIESEWGPADVVVNNAGLSIPNLVHESDPEDVRREITTNLMGPMWTSHRALPGMLKKRAGDLIFIGSDNAENPRTFQAGYSASKAGLKNFCRTLALELEGTGVRVMNMRLGPTASEFGLSWDPEILGRVITDWQTFGLTRCMAMIDPTTVAEAVIHSIKAPTSAVYASIELQPGVPVAE
jgi:NADP-dependent 3-hydroxy acid dehydrogenase YdfG